MLDRASVIHEQFIQRVKAGDFPHLKSSTSLNDAGMSLQDAMELFDSQIKSRQLDLIARELKEKGLSFYTIGSSGHEGNAVFGHIFSLTDMAFLHYRSGAFYIQRAKQVEDCDGVSDILLSMLAAEKDPISGGRHKVFGRKELNIPPQTSTIASHLPKSLGAALSIIKAKELDIQRNLADDAIVLCSFGDASFNHASAQTTINAAAWLAHQSYPLPLVMICEDNGLGISVPTPNHWIESTMKSRQGIHYIPCDGLSIADCFVKAKKAEALARSRKQMVFLHMRCIRLMGHAGSDIESQYRSQSEIEQAESQDPLLYTAGLLHREAGVSIEKILSLYEDNKALVEAKALALVNSTRLNSAKAVMSSIVPHRNNLKNYPLPSQTARREMFAATYKQLNVKKNLCQQINYALTDIMLQYPNTIVFGEDVAKKGGVYRVTADLQKRFGQRRVFDTLLDETTILGTAIGMSHNGFLPIPEIQFLAYLHNAEDQLRGEAATLSFFSNGQYQNPMVIRIASLGYQKGFGGHFHNDNSITVLRDIPGIVVACPSSGPDAARMLRRCVSLAQDEGRVVVFLEPIALYMTKDLHQVGDGQWLFEYPPPKESIDLGEVSTFGQGETVIITYGNGVYLSRQAEKILREKYSTPIKIIDIHWLHPLPSDAILKELKGAKSILIVDEGRKTGSVSEELITMLTLKGKQSLLIQRVVGEDSFIPLGTAWEHLLPSRDAIVKAILNMKASLKKEKALS